MVNNYFATLQSFPIWKWGLLIAGITIIIYMPIETWTRIKATIKLFKSPTKSDNKKQYGKRNREKGDKF